MAFENRSAVTSAEQTPSRGYEWQNFFGLNRVGDIPNRIKNDFLHIPKEDRRLFIGLANHDTCGMDDLALIYHAQHELGHIDVDIE